MAPVTMTSVPGEYLYFMTLYPLYRKNCAKNTIKTRGGGGGGNFPVKEKQETLYTQVVNSLILKVKDIVIFAVTFFSTKLYTFK